MKQNQKAALGIGGIVLVVTAVGVGLFLYSGSRLGVTALVVGIPSVLVIGVGIYVRNVIERDTTGTGDLMRQRARQTADRFQAFWRTDDRLRESYPGWERDALDDDVRRMLDELDDNGVAFNQSDGTYHVTGDGSVGVLDVLDEEIEDLEGQARESFEAFVATELTTASDALDRLRNAGLVSGHDLPSADLVDELDESGYPEEHEELLSEAREEFVDGVEAAIDRLRTVGADETGGGSLPDGVERRFEEARDAAEAADYDAAVDRLLDSRDVLTDDLADGFERRRSDLVSLADAVESSVVDDYVSGSLVERTRNVAERARGLDSALDADELDELGRELRGACTEMVAEMEEDLADDVETLEGADVPREFYSVPPAVDEAFVDRLDAADGLGEFRSRWLAAVGELSEGLDATATKASVAEGYPDMAERIRAELRRTGEVTGDDLPAKEPAAFMELYAVANEDATYDPSGPAVRVTGGGETYTLTVRPRFESGGDERELTVTVTGPEVERSRSATTHVAAELRFDSLPYGSYEVEASATDDGYATERTELTVDEDRVVEFVLTEQPLRERLCAGIDVDLESDLPEIAPEFESHFRDQGYLTDRATFPVTDDYIPCLLALWAEEAGHQLREDGGSVLVYDHEKLRNRVETILRHDLDDEPMTYETMRSRYLTVPASDELIRETIRELELDEPVAVGDEEVRKG